jgi:hypothetical protein
VGRDIAGDSTTIEITLTAHATATIVLTIRPLTATIELFLALRQAFHAVARARVAHGGRREPGTIGVAAAHGGSGGRWRAGIGDVAGVDLVVGDELVIVHLASRRQHRSEKQ